MDLAKVVARKFPDNEQEYTWKDTVLYALGIGIGAEPLDTRHLRFLYEDGLIAMPTMANVLGHPGFWAKDPEYAIDWKQLLHAEHRLMLHKPLPPEGHIVSRHDIMGVRDRGAGSSAMIHQRKSMTDAASGELIASTITTLMLRGDGGCGDYGNAPEELENLPDAAPDRSLSVVVDEILPLIYRLSGDVNPLHIDPEIAEAAGFPRPIFHGLGTMGIAAFALMKIYCDLDPGRIGSLALRFSRPLLPGDEILFDFWTDNPGTVRFRATVPDRNVMVLDRGTASVSS